MKAYHFELTITGISRGQAERIRQVLMNAIEKLRAYAIGEVDAGIVVSEEEYREGAENE